MARDIGKMDTPPFGTPIHRDPAITPVETPVIKLRRARSEIPETMDDIYVLGRWFAKPSTWSTKELINYFRPKKFKYLGLPGGIDLNNRFMTPLRELAYEGAHLHNFHAIVGRLGASLENHCTARDLSTDYNAWHDLILKAFFLDMLRTSHPTTGETLAQLWIPSLDNFMKASSLLRGVSAHAHMDDYSKAAALRVFGYAVSFFRSCSKTPRHDTYRLATLDHLEYFQAHRNPLIATAATFSFRALLRIGR